MCSSTPSTCTPANRCSSLTSRSRTGLIASQTVCQSTPRRPGDALDAGVVPAQLADDPPDRPRRQHRPRRHQRRQLLGERPDRASRIGAHVRAFAPDHRHRGAEARDVMHEPVPTPVPVGDDAAAPAPLQARRGLDRDPQPLLGAHDVDDVHTVQAEQNVTARAVAAGRAAARRRVTHRRGPPEAPVAWSLPILRTSTPTPTQPAPPARRPLRPPHPQIRRAGLHSEPRHGLTGHSRWIHWRSPSVGVDLEVEVAAGGVAGTGGVEGSVAADGGDGLALGDGVADADADPSLVKSVSA